MVSFLIRRPVAVLMVLTASLVLGVVAMRMLPVSLVPDVDIPRISVQVSAPEMSASELENTIMQPLRSNLMQVNNLEELRSQANDGNGSVTLHLSHGTNINLAYIEINELVDRAVAAMPRGTERPAVLKASASDIPVFYLDLSLRNGERNMTRSQFFELGSFADEVIRRRLEQLPQVAMADISGRTFSEIVVKPDNALLEAMNIPPTVIENTIAAANMRFGNIILRDLQFQYHVRVGHNMVDAADIGNLYLNHEGRIWQVKDLCTIETSTAEPQGMVLSNGRRSITMAIVKQGDARMQDFKENLHSLVGQLETDYPELQFTISRDQTKLLDATISNLSQTLLIGALLAFVVMFLFLRDPRSPWIIVVSVPAALVVSLLFFYFVNLSINVVSVSGLILCIGLMIDNSIIVIDNITRYRRKGLSLHDACVAGTNEVFTPLLSSVLTTCSVFVPLVFLGGVAGALFFDQAMAITIGLFTSLAVAMIVIPVIYHILYRKANVRSNGLTPTRKVWFDYQSLYTRVFKAVMRRQGIVWGLVVLLLASLYFTFTFVEKENLPRTERKAALLWIDWNANLNIDENKDRIETMLDAIGSGAVQTNVLVGRQQFLLQNQHQLTPSQALVYIETESQEQIQQMEQAATGHFSSKYPNALLNVLPEDNIFDMVFGETMAPLQVRLKPTRDLGSEGHKAVSNMLEKMQEALPDVTIDPLPLNQIMVLETNMQMLALHQVDKPALVTELRRMLNQNQVARLLDGRAAVPINVGATQSDFFANLPKAFVKNRNGINVPVSLLVNVSTDLAIPSIIAGLEGPYFPVDLNIAQDQLNPVTSSVNELVQADNTFEVDYAGSIFSRQELANQLLVIGIIALLLLFFILAAQFESLLLPFIILFEVPVATAGAMLVLMATGQTLNLMSMIGLVVMAGIIINDSILKIATINRLLRKGAPILRALMEAGHIRLKAIIMTSITTILALLPILFISGIGGQMQRPLAIAIMAGLAIGTMVSLYLLPSLYYLIYRLKKI